MTAAAALILFLGQIEPVTPGQAPGIGPPGFFDPLPRADGGASAAAVGSDGGTRNPLLLETPTADGGPSPSDAGPPEVGSSDAGSPDAGPVVNQARADLVDAAAEAARTSAAAADAARRAEEALQKLQAAEAGHAPPKAPASGFSGTANVSLIAFTGNSQAVTLSAGFGITKNFADGWILSTGGALKYGEATVIAGQPDQVTALQADGYARGDRVLWRSLTAYALGGLDTDHIDSLELREYGEGGLALFLFDRKDGDLERLMFRTDLGLRYMNESRFQYYPYQINLGDVTFLGPRLGLAFHVALSKDLAFSQEGEVLKDATSTRVLVNTNTKLAVRLVKQLALTASYLINYDSSPPLNRLTTDTALTVGIEYKF